MYFTPVLERIKPKGGTLSDVNMWGTLNTLGSPLSLQGGSLAPKTSITRQAFGQVLPSSTVLAFAGEVKPKIAASRKHRALACLTSSLVLRLLQLFRDSLSCCSAMSSVVPWHVFCYAVPSSLVLRRAWLFCDNHYCSAALLVVLWHAE